MLLSPNLHPPSHLPSLVSHLSACKFLVLFTTILWHIWFLHRTVLCFYCQVCKFLGNIQDSPAKFSILRVGTTV